MTDETQETDKQEIDLKTVAPYKPLAYARSRYEYTYRLRIVTIAVPGLVGLLILLIPAEFWYRVSPFFEPSMRGERSIYVTLLAVTAFASSAFGVIMFYLQTGFKRDLREREQLLDFESEFKTKSSEIANTVSRAVALTVHDAEDRLSRLEKDRQNTAILTEVERKKLVRDIASRLQDDASADLLDRLEAQAHARIAELARHDVIEEQFALSARRLNGEITALGRRGNLNLALGIVTTVVGLSLLGYFVVRTSSQPEELSTFAVHFIPRLSLVIFIEVFAYFFLKLYKATLSEIKYFQNEMTNIEAKFTAARAAFALSDSKVVELVIKQLALTERNYLLKKGETTVQLEQQKRDTELAAEIGKHVTEAVRSVAKR